MSAASSSPAGHGFSSADRAMPSGAGSIPRLCVVSADSAFSSGPFALALRGVPDQPGDLIGLLHQGEVARARDDDQLQVLTRLEDLALIGGEPDVVVLSEDNASRQMRVAQCLRQRAVAIEVREIRPRLAPDVARLVRPHGGDQRGALFGRQAAGHQRPDQPDEQRIWQVPEGDRQPIEDAREDGFVGPREARRQEHEPARELPGSRRLQGDIRADAMADDHSTLVGARQRRGLPAALFERGGRQRRRAAIPGEGGRDAADVRGHPLELGDDRGIERCALEASREHQDAGRRVHGAGLSDGPTVVVTDSIHVPSLSG